MHIGRVSQHPLHSHIPGFSIRDVFGLRTPENKKPVKKELEPSYVKNAFKHFFLPTSKSDSLKRVLNGVILTFAILKASPFWMALNKTAQEMDISPKPVVASVTEALPHHPEIDNFITNHINPNDLDFILGLINKTEKNDIDLNKNGIILDTEEEINELIKLIEGKLTDPSIKEQLRDLEPILTKAAKAQHCLWSNRPDPMSISQNGPNCQATSTIIGLCLTDSNIQKLKKLVTITDYELDPKNFHINAKVNINGENIEVIYNDFNKWRRIGSPLLKEYYPNYSLGPDFVAYALEQKMKKDHIPMPSSIPSSTDTLLTKEDFYAYPVMFLSDRELIRILGSAPENLITTGSSPDLLTYGTKIGLCKDQNEGLPTPSAIMSNHAYAVKGIKIKNGEHIITLLCTDPNQNKVQILDLNLQEFRQSMISISANKNIFSDYNKEEIISTLVFSALLLLLVRQAINKYELKKKLKASA